MALFTHRSRIFYINFQSEIDTKVSPDAVQIMTL